MRDEKQSLEETLNRIVERVHMFFQNPVVVRDESKTALSRYRGILYYYLVLSIRPWKFFKSLAPRRPVFRVIPYFSNNPNEEQRKQLSYIVWGDNNVLRIVDEELRKYADEFGFTVRDLHVPSDEEMSPIRQFLDGLNNPI
jgi:hypothetical protein